MKNQTTLFIVVCTICFLFYRCNTASSDNSTIADSSASRNMYAGFASQIDWGHHLTIVSGCNDCHTPKKMTDKGPVDDTTLLLSGHPSQIPPPVLLPEQLAKGLAATNDLTAWNGPWGTSYAANLTPDSSGLAGWSEQQFINCLRKGWFKGLDGTRPIMPPMPINDISKMTDDELKALFAYLKTIKPVHNLVPDYQPPTGAAK